MTNGKKHIFGAYYIDREYLDALRQNDNDHISYADYEDKGGARKFYCGPVMTEHGIDYYVPVSHSEHNMYIQGSAQNGIKEYHGINMVTRSCEHIGCLDFRYMIPCVDDRFIESHTPHGHGKTQMNFCYEHENEIKMLARDTYNNITADTYPELTRSSVKFEKALGTAWDYLDKVEEKEEADKQKAKISMRYTTASHMTCNISTEADIFDFTKG